MAHLTRQTKTIHNIQDFTEMLPIGLEVHRKRLLFEISPHHLEVQTAAANHQLKVVSSPPALA